MAKIARYALFAATVFLILAGIVAGISQSQQGLVKTGLHEPVVWGLYVVCFVFFMGIGAGAMFAASLALCTGQEEYRPFVRVGSVVSLVCLMLAGMFITIDLGRPERAFLLMLKPQLSSPLIWDFFILNAMLVVAAIYTLFALRRDVLARAGHSGFLSRLLGLGGTPGETGRVPMPVRILAGMMVFGVPILYLLTVRVFATLRARADWNTTVLGPVFLVSAMISGLAAICVVAGFCYRTKQQTDRAPRVWRILRNSLIALITIDIIVTFSPLVSMRQFNSPSRLVIWSEFGGATVLELLAGMLVPLVILVTARKKLQPWSVVAGMLILFGVFVKRWHIIIPAMLQRSLPLPPASYQPSVVEYAISVGIAAFGVSLMYLLMQVGYGPDRAATEHL